MQFTVAPSISGLSPLSGPVGTSVSITGSSFGSTQGTSTVTFNGTPSTPSTWTDTQIIAPVPVGATTGNVIVTVASLASNAVTFTVTSGTPPSISASVSPSPNANGWNNSNVTVTFTCTAGSAAIANCPSPQTVSTEGANQIVSGTATDTNGLTATTSVTLNIDKTQPAVAVTSPTDGTGFSTAAVTISGTASDSLSGVSSVTCDGAAANVSGGNFSCNISLNLGVNLAVVRVTDLAGNISGSNFHLTLNGGFPAPNSLQITPTGVNMVVGQTQQFVASDELGRPRSEATWTISDTTIASITTDSSPTLTALAVGQVTLTATVQSSTAQIQINILGGTSLPAGTVIWSVPSIGGFGGGGIIQAVPTGGNTPDLYNIDTDANGNTRIRGFSADGLQMMQTTAAPGGASPDGLGGVLITSTSGLYPNITTTVSDQDGVTGAQVWSYSTQAITSTKAIRQDGAVFHIETTAPDPTHSNSDSSSLVAVDGTVGAPLLRLPLPSTTDQVIDCNGVLVRNQTIGPTNVSNLEIDSDGTVSIAIDVETELTNGSDCQGGPSSVPYTSKLYLFQLRPDGSTSMTLIHTNTEDLATATTGRLPRAWPWRLIPDGSGGSLIAWTDYSQTQPLDYITHLGSSGQNDYPFSSLSEEISSMVLGDNGSAFATDSQTIQAFNISTGQSLWSYVSPAIQGIAITGATDGGGLATKEFDNHGFVSPMLLDSSGNPTYSTWLSSAAASTGVTGFKSLAFFLADAFIANSGSPVQSFILASGQPLDWPVGDPWASEPDTEAAQSTHITLNVFQVQGTSVSANGSIASQVQHAQKLWANKVQGLTLDWNISIPSILDCDPAFTTSSQTCANTPQLHLSNFDSPSSCGSDTNTIGWLALTDRFPNAPGPNNKGLRILFTNTITFDPPLTFVLNPIETVPYDSPLTCETGNDIMMSNQAYANVLAHAIGHVFGLGDLRGASAAGPPAPANTDGDNLMCSDDATHCPDPSRQGAFLTPRQVESARKGLFKWK